MKWAILLSRAFVGILQSIECPYKTQSVGVPVNILVNYKNIIRINAYLANEFNRCYITITNPNTRSHFNITNIHAISHNVTAVGTMSNHTKSVRFALNEINKWHKNRPKKIDSFQLFGWIVSNRYICMALVDDFMHYVYVICANVINLRVCYFCLIRTKKQIPGHIDYIRAIVGAVGFAKWRYLKNNNRSWTLTICDKNYISTDIS